MSLITCPECNEKVSDRAQYCVHCGFPLCEAPNTREPVVPMTYSVVITRFSGARLQDVADVLSRYNKTEPKALMPILHRLPAVLISGQPSETCRNIVANLNVEGISADVRSDREASKVPKFPNSEAGIGQSASVVRCPHCGSTNIYKISTTSRMISTGLFGLASSKIGKTMQCKKCGYKW